MRQQFLRLTGIRDSNGRLHLRPDGFAELAIGDSIPRTSIRAELVDATGAVVAAERLVRIEVCSFPHRHADHEYLAHVPWHESATRARFLQEDVVLAEGDIERVTPSVSFEWRPEGLVSGRHMIRWNAQHPLGRTMAFRVRFRTGPEGQWRPISLRTTDTHMVLDFDTLPGGRTCTLSVVADDGINRATAESAYFTVAIKPCHALILSPTQDFEVEAGDLVTLRGVGQYLEEGRTEMDALTWTSSLDGGLGKGALIETRHLSVGEHVLTLTAGGGKRTGTATRQLRVRGVSRNCS